MTVEGFIGRIVGVSLLITLGMLCFWGAYSSIGVDAFSVVIGIIFGVLFLSLGIGWGIEFYMTWTRQWNVGKMEKEDDIRPPKKPAGIQTAYLRTP